MKKYLIIIILLLGTNVYADGLKNGFNSIDSSSDDITNNSTVPGTSQTDVNNYLLSAGGGGGGSTTASPSFSILDSVFQLYTDSSINSFSLSMKPATAAQNGYLLSTDWSIFDAKADQADINTANALILKNTLERTERLEPNGFIFPEDYVVASFSNTTRTFEIGVKNASFTFYSNGNRYNKTGSESIVISDVEGLHYIYYDDDTLAESTTFSMDFILKKCFAGAVYWDADNNSCIWFGAEYLHGSKMESKTHSYLHLTRGFALATGGVLSDILTEQSGALDSHAQFSNETTVAYDEDARFDFPARLSTAIMPIYYRDGIDSENIWRMFDNTSFPVVATDTGRIGYNQLVSTKWQITEVSNNDFMCVHIATTNDFDRPFIAFMGQTDYLTRNAARTGAIDEINSMVLSGMPSMEFKFLGTIIFQTSDSYTNAVKARIRSTDDGADYVDLRGSFFTAGGTSGIVTDHNSLAGLQGGTAGSYYHSAIDLSSVTNDSQLKRAAGDFVTFTKKTSPVASDRLMIEDSADSNNKKYIEVGDLPSSGSGSGGNTIIPLLSVSAVGTASYVISSNSVKLYYDDIGGVDFSSFIVPDNWNASSDFNLYFWGNIATGEAAKYMKFRLDYQIISAGTTAFSSSGYTTGTSGVLSVANQTTNQVLSSTTYSVPAGSLEIGDTVYLQLWRDANDSADTYEQFLYIPSAYLKFNQ